MYQHQNLCLNTYTKILNFDTMAITDPFLSKTSVLGLAERVALSPPPQVFDLSETTVNFDIVGSGNQNANAAFEVPSQTADLTILRNLNNIGLFCSFLFTTKNLNGYGSSFDLFAFGSVSHISGTTASKSLIIPIFATSFSGSGFSNLFVYGNHGGSIKLKITSSTATISITLRQFSEQRIK